MMDIGHCLKIQLSDMKGVGCENYRNLKIAKGWKEHEFEQLCLALSASFLLTGGPSGPSRSCVNLSAHETQ